MGTKMKAKFDSACKKCGNATKEGEDIFYDYDTKVACGNLECYKEQGGSAIEEKKTGGGGYKPAPLRPIAERQADVKSTMDFAVGLLQEVCKKVPIPEDQMATFLESIVKTTVSSR